MDKRRVVIILQHAISYWFEKYDLEVNDIDIEHIEQCIKDGCNQGELNQLVGENEEVRGWWKIERDAIIN